MLATLTTPRMSRLAVLCLCAVGLALPEARADVLVVSPGGPYTTPQQAIDAAVDGDTVLVAGTGYPGFTIDGKGLEVVGDGGEVEVHGTIRVRNVGAGQRVLVSGFRSQGLVDTHNGLGLLVQNNAGAVRFADCAFYGASSPAHVEWDCSDDAVVVGVPTGSHGAWISSSSQDLAFVRCHFQGGDAASTYTEYFFSTCWDLCVCLPGYDGGHGLLLVNSTVSLHDCTALGGRGGDADITGGFGGDGVHGILGTIVSSGGAYVGGEGGIGWDYIWSSGGDGGAGWRGSSTTTAYHIDDFALGGEGNFGFTGPSGDDGPDFAEAGPHGTFPGAARSFTIDSPVREGELADFAFGGQPGDLVFLILSLADGQVLLPHFQGTLLLGVPLELVELVGILPGSGTLGASIAAPELPPGFEALSFRLQALMSPDGTTAVLSSWAPFVILDAAF